MIFFPFVCAAAATLFSGEVNHFPWDSLVISSLATWPLASGWRVILFIPFFLFLYFSLNPSQPCRLMTTLWPTFLLFWALMLLSLEHPNLLTFVTCNWKNLMISQNEKSKAFSLSYLPLNLLPCLFLRKNLLMFKRSGNTLCSDML